MSKDHTLLSMLIFDLVVDTIIPRNRVRQMYLVDMISRDIDNLIEYQRRKRGMFFRHVPSEKVVKDDDRSDYEHTDSVNDDLKLMIMLCKLMIKMTSVVTMVPLLLMLQQRRRLLLLLLLLRMVQILLITMLKVGHIV